MYITIDKEVRRSEKMRFQRSEIEKMEMRLLTPNISSLDKKIIRDSINRHRLELNKLLRS